MSWTTNKLGSICDESGGNIQTGPFGSQLHGGDYVAEGIPVIMPKDIKNDQVDITSAAKISVMMSNKLRKHRLKRSDIVFPRRGDINKRALISEEIEGSICGTGCLKIEVPQKILNPKFLYYFLKQPAIVDWITNQSIGATMENLNTEILRSVPIRFPDLASQQRIASILFSYDDLIEVNNQRIKLLEETAHVLYKEWFVRMRFPGYKKAKFVKGIPEGWEVGTCYSFAVVSGGGTPSTTNSAYWDGDIKFFTPTDYADSVFVTKTEKQITRKGLENCSTKMFPRYTSFVTARGSVGNICLASEEMAMNQSCFGLTATRSEDTFYLFLFLQGMVGYLQLVATGATFDAITLRTFHDYKQPIASEDIRAKFDIIIAPIYQTIENLLQQNSELRQIRDRLLPRLISGKLQLKEPKEAKVVAIKQPPVSMVAETETLYKKKAK